MRLIAGLEEPSEGRILIGGRDVTRVDPGDRDVAMVFQSYALYPHMTAAENMMLNLTVRGMRKAEAAARARETARLLGIEDLLDKKPARLSGGQRQRVALGRAIVRRPVAFLMDEPLSNLDLKLREQMRTELKALHARLKITTVYVTHDQAEALILSDRVVVMNEGRIEQLGDPIRIYERPANRFVAEFIGSPSINLVRAHHSAEGLRVAGQPVSAEPIQQRSAGDVLVGVRPEDVMLVQPDKGLLNGTIQFCEPYGSVVYAFIELRPATGLAEGRTHFVASMDPHRALGPGQAVGIDIRWERVSLFDPLSGESLASPSRSSAGDGSAKREVG